jgi:peptidoglycan-N-acetylglucosamine deacetylase
VRYRVLRPPYCYRWAGLITVVAVLVSLVGWVSGPADAGQALGTPGARDPLPATASQDLLSHTAHGGRTVALTFDDGPDPSYTPHVLELLTRYRAVATFCMIGNEAIRYPDLVRDVVTAGMRLCDHTVTHPDNLDTQPVPLIEAEIIGGRAVLLIAAGRDVEVMYYRASLGRWSDPMRRIAADHGMRPLAWSLDSLDWTEPGTERIVDTVQQQMHPGAVVLLHDGGGDREQTVAALEVLLPWLVEQGYRFVVPA